MKCILLADDNFGLRSALRLLLEIRLSAKVVLTARDMENVLAKVEELRPDCIILDWELLDGTAPRLLPVLRTRIPGLKIVAVSARPESKQSARKEGVDVFISKAESPSVILEKLQEIYLTVKHV
jgi:DNA-binding NarL/FixJ family response regulator